MRITLPHLSNMRRTAGRVGFSLAAFFSLSSMMPYQDPSLLAAEEYNPALWNGSISNDELAREFESNRPLIRRLEQEVFGSERLESDFPRAAHRQMDHMNLLANDVHYSITSSNISSADYARYITYKTGTPYYQALSFTFTLERIYRERRFQERANCYGYAINDHNNPSYGVNPGNRFHPYEMTLYELKDNRAQYQDYVRATIRGAVSDGLQFTGNEYPTRAGYYRVALLIRPADRDRNITNEYHWVRQNNDGTWSHKYGNQNVTNIDFGGRPITDVRTADFDDYNFIGYFLVPQGGIDGNIAQFRPGQEPPVVELPPGPDIVITARRNPT